MEMKSSQPVDLFMENPREIIGRPSLDFGGKSDKPILI
jgi:hypothetical protein